MRTDVREAVAAALGSSVQRHQAVSGGDINEAYLVELNNGERAFVKANAQASPELFRAEAKGLEWLSEPGVIRIPQVLAVNGSDGPAFLVIEYLESGAPRPNFDDELGQSLAALHRSGASEFGLNHDNFIGPLPQSNRPAPTWPEFFRERRLRPQVERATRAGLFGRGIVASFEKLYSRLDELVGPAEPPQRLHGDLWGGNLHVTPEGDPCLIDPAVYGGHREVDLAMMRLFGGFGSRAFAAYAEAYPLTPGAGERVSLYQLYPLLVHVNVFGGSYVGSVKSALSRYV